MTSDKTTIKRLPDRGAYDRDAIHAIIDEALICHVAFIAPEGHPVVIPTIHARRGDTLFLHGSPASRLLRIASTNAVSVGITLVDGVVVARAPFHMSLNYRSVVIFGEPIRVRDREAKREALRVITEHVTPGRWADSRLPSESELRQTEVLALPISEASEKARSGPPVDDEEDYALGHWAGVVPLRTTVGDLVPDPRLGPGIESPEYLVGYRPSGAT